MATTPKASRLDLHAALREHSYDFGVLTTSAFDPAFFESYCLDRLTALADNANLAIIMDARTYSTLVALPPADRPKHANLRYLIHPIAVPGTFSARLVLLGTKRKGRLIVASANLTQSSLTLNAELATVFDTDVDADDTYQPLLADAFQFVRRLLDRSPSEALRAHLEFIEAEAGWLRSGATATPALPMRLIHNLDASILDSIASHLAGADVKAIWILSPAFDDQPTLLTRLDELLRPRTIKILTDSRRASLSRNWLQHPLMKSGRARPFACSYSTDGHAQPLHAAAIILETRTNLFLLTGSATFTTPALAEDVSAGNVEVVLLYTLPPRTLDPDRFCDPADSAVPLTIFVSPPSSPGPLPPEPPTSPTPEPILHLLEVSLNEERLVAVVALPALPSFDSLVASLSFGDGTSAMVALHQSQPGRYAGDLPPEAAPRANRESTVVSLIAHKTAAKVAESNAVFLTNLLDIDSGQNVHRQRQIRAAREGVPEFFNVLHDLLGDDEEALKLFLTLCDIPILDAPGPPRRRVRVAIEFSGMRTLGERNLTIFASLHEAAVHFLDKHLKRLKRLVDHSTLAGIFNFTHIALAVGGVIVAQIERIVAGLDALRTPLSIDAWWGHRDRVGIYVDRFALLARRIADEYLPSMLKRHPERSVAERLADDVPIFYELVGRFVQAREALEELRRGHLRLGVGPLMTQIVPPWNDKVDLFSQAHWPSLMDTLDRQLLALKRLVPPNGTQASSTDVAAGLPGVSADRR